MDIEEATVEFQHPCIDRALAAESGGEKSKTPQARPILGEIRRKRRGVKMERVVSFGYIIIT